MTFIKMSSFRSKKDLSGNEVLIALDNGNIRIPVNELKYFLGVGSQSAFRGVAYPDYDPGEQKQPGFWPASEPGVYTHFGGVVLPESSIGFISWEKETGFQIRYFTLNMDDYALNADFNPIQKYVNDFLMGVFSGDGAHPFSIKDQEDKAAVIIDQAGFFIAMKYALDSINANALKNGTIEKDKFSENALSDVTPLSKFNPIKEYVDKFLRALFGDSIYPFAIQDLEGRAGLFLDNQGFFTAAKYALKTVPGEAIKDNTIALQQLTEVVKGLMYSPMESEKTGYILAFKDTAGKVAFGIKTTGELVGKFGNGGGSGTGLTDNSVKTSYLQDGAVTTPKIADKAVTSGKLSDLVKRKELAINNDYAIMSDDLTRGQYVDTPSYTNKRGGLFAPLSGIAAARTLLYNNSGTAIQIRKKHFLTESIKGTKYRGEFTPGAATTLAKSYRGFVHTNQYPATAGLNIGDYYVIALTSSSIVINSISYNQGDLIVFTGTQFERHEAPRSVTIFEDMITYITAEIGDFWHVKESGKFGYYDLLPGDIIFSPARTMHGGPGAPVFVKRKEGQLFYMGDLNPADQISDPYNGDIYTAAASGDFLGHDIEVDDYIFRNDNSWFTSPSNEITERSIGLHFQGGYCELPGKADDYEIRRKDKSDVIVAVTCKSALFSSKVVHSDNIVIFGDSMPGTATSGSAFATVLKSKFPDRAISVKSYGGARSRDVLQMLKYNALTEDLFKDQIHVFWHGQNNHTDLAQIQQSSIEMAKYTGALNPRYIFMSVIGDRSDAWYDGVRLNFNNFEGQFWQGNNQYFLEQWYNQIFKDTFFNTRKALLDAAKNRTQKDPQFPGMTESEVAENYGIPPFSFWFNFTGKPFTSENIVFTGYHEPAALPDNSIGSDLDYKLRSHMQHGTVGNSLIVKVAGVWSEFKFDVIHLNGTGAAVLADLFNNYLISKNF